MSGGGKGASAQKAPSMGQQLSGQNAYSVYDTLLGLQASNVNQTTPFGTSTYTPTKYENINFPSKSGPGAVKTLPSQYSATTTFSPEMQQVYDQYIGGLQGLGQAANQGIASNAGSLGSPLDLSSLGAAPSGVNAADRQSAIDQLMAFQAPQTQQDREALDSQLANQGVTAGSTAYGNAHQSLEDQIARNRLGAVQAGQDYATQNFQTAEQARTQKLNELLSGRSVPLNEIMAMQGAVGGGIQQPLTGAAPVPAAQVSTPSYQYVPQPAQSNQGLSALVGLAQAGATAYGSDRRLKVDIEALGIEHAGVPWYRFRYAGDDEMHVGVMHDEVERLRPEAAFRIDGIGHVSYGVLLCQQ